MEEVIDLMQNKYCSDKDDTPIRAIIERNLKDSKHKRQFEKLVRKIRQEYREDGFVNIPTIQEFNKLVNELASTQFEDTVVNKVEDVLYYAKESN